MAGFLDMLLDQYKNLGKSTEEKVYNYLIAEGVDPERARREAERVGGKIESRQGLLEMAVPQDALDVGLMVAGGPGGKMARRVAGGVIAAMDPEDAEAGVAKKTAKKATGVIKGAVDEAKTWWDDLSKTKLTVPLEDMRATREQTAQMLPKKTLSPEELQGSILTPAVGDRTIAGQTLTAINDKPLAFPVKLEGGPDFMRSPAMMADNAIWASDKGVITRLAKHARELGETGKDVNFVYSSMGARSGDYSHMMSDALLAQIPDAKITKKSIAEFDASMRKQNPNWPGLKDPQLRETLLQNGPMRKQMVEEMALGDWEKLGFPNAGSTRFAITEPGLIGKPTGSSGFSVARLDPQGRVIPDPTIPHTTYNTQLGGLDYRGGTEVPIPRDVMFPNFFAQRRASGAPVLADDRAFSMSNVSQQADQQWLDGVMRYIEEQRRLGGQ